VVTIKTAAIVLSRQQLRPSLLDPWVQDLKKAVEFVKRADLVLCTSVGTPNWEIITACAVMQKIPLKIFIPKSESNDFDRIKFDLVNEFQLNQSVFDFLAVSMGGNNTTNEQLWKWRDQEVLGASDVLIPVSVRTTGYLAELIEMEKTKGKEVVTQFQVKYGRYKPKLSYTIIDKDLSDEIRQIGQEYVIHWTRSSNGPWPGETKADFYKAVLSSESYPRAARDTFSRILTTKKILASSKNMPQRVGTVSFSALAPIDAIKLMRWRARYHHMSFEPFGIGIEKETGMANGINEVQYQDDDGSKVSNTIPVWLTQSIGRITDWRHEQEYRHKGDFDFSKISASKLIAICHRKTEAALLERDTGLKTIWFCQ